MDAGKWAEVEPRQDGGPEDGWPHHQWSGKLSHLGRVAVSNKFQVIYDIILEE